MVRRDIYVHPSTDWLGGDVSDALGRLAPVQFKSCTKLTECRQGDAVLSLSGDDQVSKELSRSRVRYFHAARQPVGPRSESQGEAVRFANSNRLDPLLRGRTIQHQLVSNLASVCIESGDEVLAHYGEQPVWVIRPVGDLAGHIVSTPLPQPAPGEQSFDYLNGYHFIQLLPLLHFLREVTIDLDWVRPPLRACFTFDDPNLHWSSYGFLSYRALIQQARKDRFHVSLATVPLDAWAPNSRTVGLLKENTEHCSLLMHGNDHTRDELSRVRTHERHQSIMAQSLRRIERLERVTGLHVDRVMVPPHEALVDGVVATMPPLGFEGASLTPWSLRYWNPKRAWPSTFGLELGEMMDAGCPVLGRYKLTDTCEGPSVISAFLGRPIVLVEHHQAVASGLELLSSAAAVINSLGNVRWCSIETMLRENYLRRQEDGTLWIKPYSCRIRLSVPEGVGSVALSAPERTDGVGEFTLTRKPADAEATSTRVRVGVPFDVVPGDTIELSSINLGTVDHRDVETPGLSAWALSRRVLCEARDRLVAIRKPRWW